MFSKQTNWYVEKSKQFDEIRNDMPILPKLYALELSDALKNYAKSTPFTCECFTSALKIYSLQVKISTLKSY